jgi:SWI/SNF-related matrix-associated actin-dependent regulator 1 of chromatin subfamily A
MELTYRDSDKMFVFAGTTYADRDIPRDAGFKWHPDRRFWYTLDAEIAAELREYADEATQEALATALASASEVADERAAAEDAKIASSKATSSDIVIPAPAGLSYMPFQKAGIEYALSRKETLIADEQGLGKTIQVLGVANFELDRREGNLKILIVAPKIALRNWMREAQKWLIRQHSIAVWTTKSQAAADICIVNYDILSKPIIAAALRAQTWDIAAYDEAHALKDFKAKRTQHALGSRKDKIEPIRAGRRLFLTGTPILNRPIELFPLLSAMGVAGCTGFFDYAKRFCAGRETKFGFDASGASNLPELQALLRKSVMVRRLKKDVLTELPAKRYAAVELDADTPELRKCITAEARFAKDSEARSENLKAEIAALKASHAGEATVAAAMARLRAGKLADFHEMSRLRHDTALAKVPGVVEHVSEFLGGGEESLLLFAHHTDVITALEAGIREAGYECAVITGATSEADRQKAQDDVQAKRKRVFIGSMRACGVAITLTAASTVIFAEQDWVPGIMRQAEDRAHRIGQESAVLVQYLVVDGSFDCTMAAKVVAKEGVIDAALDGSDEIEAISVAPVMEMVAEAEGAAPEAIAPEAIEPEAIELTDEVAIAEPALELAAPDEVALISVAPAAELPAAPEAAPIVKRGRGRPPVGEKAMSPADRRRAWKAANQVIRVELPGELMARIRDERAMRGMSTIELLAAALDALVAREAGELDKAA